MMNKHLEQLIEVVTLDKDIDAMEPLIQQKRFKIEKLIKAKTSKEQTLLRIQEEEEGLYLEKKKKDHMIEDMEARLENIAAKSKDIKSERELKALNIEEELAREQLNKAHSDIEFFNKKQEQKQQEKMELEKDIRQLEEEIHEEEGIVTDEIQSIKSKQEELFLKRQDIYATLDQKLAIFYEKIRKWARNTSVVPVNKQACGGCFIYINDHIFSEIKQSNDIITCPHCGRILYIQE